MDELQFYFAVKSKFVKNLMPANTIERQMYNYFTQLNDAEQKRIAEMLKTFTKSKKFEPENCIDIAQYNK